MSVPSAPRIRIGARSSPLSMAQVAHVTALLERRGIAVDFVPITTRGDVDRRELTQIGGTGVFAAAVRTAVLAGEVDLAVHSAKDLPTAAVAGLSVVAHPPREDVRDVLVGVRLDQLRDGIRIGTGSPRRAAQVRHWADERGIDVEVVGVRGNVGTRLGLVGGPVDAVVLAAAGLRRLGLLDGAAPHAEIPATLRVNSLPAEVLSVERMVPAPGQGALALEVRSSDEMILNQVRDLDDPDTSAAVRAERAYLARLEAGCLAPTGALAVVDHGCGISADLTMTAVIGRTVVRGRDPDSTATVSPGSDAPGTGLVTVRGTGSSADPEELGNRLAGELLDQGLGSDN